MTHNQLREMACLKEEAAITATFLVEASGWQLIGHWWKEEVSQFKMVSWIDDSYISRQDLEKCVCIKSCAQNYKTSILVINMTTSMMARQKKIAIHQNNLV